MIWALHGAVGSDRDWTELIHDFCAVGLKCEALDLWSFLDSDKVSLKEVGARIAAHIRARDDDPIILGYSMGGRIALHALISQPDQWRAAVIVSAHTGLCSSEEKTARKARDLDWSEKALSCEWAEFLNEWQDQGVLQPMGQPSANLADRMLLKDKSRQISQSFIDWSLGAQEDLLPSLDQINCPMLWLTGESDQKFTQVAASAVDELSVAEHVILPACGHRLPWESSPEFVAQCERFIKIYQTR